MEIKLDTSNLKNVARAMRDFPELAKKSLPPAINRTLSAVNTKIQKGITKIYKIKKSDLSGGKKYKSESSNNLINIKKASVKNPSGQIEVRGRTLNLARFLQTPKGPVSTKGMKKAAIRRRKPAKVQVKKGKSKYIAKTFVQKSRGAVGIFTRDHNGKLKMLHTLSVAQMASNKEVLKSAEQTAVETLEKRIEHELEYRLDKLAGEVNGNS
ncbi:hypothetical protein EHE19_001570 [Ruminiclostridium herbifermentans]|uniref:Prophage minor tail protein Z (GPZ) n=1 Tax=Ruminiclostridium herbifermentans TaxID=2488810 RepID=A0A4U7JBF4_9FIRM|nr:hypothetical protein [Ruminiclostridium herbifermentans]QNU67260.1 hypothetical protein EHE19_001570 [Ruminiclostridium herbifermentans]